MADFDEECSIITEYIINNVSTVQMPKQFGYEPSTIEYVFKKYNINYPDRQNGHRGKGFHLGKYKKGYRNNLGKIIPVTRDDIEDYMDAYLDDEYDTLEEYLADQYDVYEEYEQEEPEPPPAPKPVPKAPPPVPQAPPPARPAVQSVWANIPSDDSTDDLIEEPMPPMPRFKPSYSYAPVGSPVPNIIPAVIVIGIIIFFVFKFIPTSGGGLFNIGDNAEKNSQTHFSADEISDVELNVYFYGEKSDLLFQNKYIICVDTSDEAVLTIGAKNEFLLRTNKGKHKIWVKSGMDKSKVYTVNITDDKAVIDFDCEIGVFKPKFNLTSIEGAEKD